MYKIVFYIPLTKGLINGVNSMSDVVQPYQTCLHTLAVTVHY